ncbi:MAG TPA: hypothetical protein VMU22_11905 [Rhizomicrobium sp.]|nr:hypothetical protein [Rhizomicrobium sp.]
MTDWHDIGVRIAALLAKEPPHIQIAFGLATAFTALMILEGLRASFGPRRSEGTRRRPPAKPGVRSADTGAVKQPRNPKRDRIVINPHRAARPTIRRPGAGDTPDASRPPQSPFEE